MSLELLDEEKDSIETELAEHERKASFDLQINQSLYHSIPDQPTTLSKHHSSGLSAIKN
jgi:hypothetical protein